MDLQLHLPSPPPKKAKTFFQFTVYLISCTEFDCNICQTVYLRDLCIEKKLKVMRKPFWDILFYNGSQDLSKLKKKCVHENEIFNFCCLQKHFSKNTSHLVSPQTVELNTQKPSFNIQRSHSKSISKETKCTNVLRYLI